jgi:hypothetical protein
MVAFRTRHVLDALCLHSLYRNRSIVPHHSHPAASVLDNLPNSHVFLTIYLDRPLTGSSSPNASKRANPLTDIHKHTLKSYAIGKCADHECGHINMKAHSREHRAMISINMSILSQTDALFSCSVPCAHGRSTCAHWL